MIARLSALDATFAPRGPQEGIMGKHCGSLSTRKPTEPPYVVNCKTSTGLWKPLFNAKGEGTVSAPDGRARCHEGAAAQGRPDDGNGLPWGGKGEMLTQVERISKKTILAAGLRPELTFTSLGRHGGATEANTSGRTETQLMTKGQWSSTAAMGNYLHDDDEGKQDAQMKRMKRRAK